MHMHGIAKYEVTTIMQLMVPRRTLVTTINLDTQVISHDGLYGTLIPEYTGF